MVNWKPAGPPAPHSQYWAQLARFAGQSVRLPHPAHLQTVSPASARIQPQDNFMPPILNPIGESGGIATPWQPGGNR